MKPHDIFEANDLFENTNYTQVQSTLITLAGIVSPGSSTANHRKIPNRNSDNIVRPSLLTIYIRF